MSAVNLLSELLDVRARRLENLWLGL